jgi:hypothetical protein
MNKNSYLREAWNIMDFFIVVFGIISTYLNSTNLKALRAFRVLRPLRTISKVKSLKTMINTLLKSIALLKDSMIIILFYYTVFAITGSQIFSGSLKYNCFDLKTVGIMEFKGILQWDKSNSTVMC